MADAQKIMMFKSQKETEAYAEQVSSDEAVALLGVHQV